MPGSGHGSATNVIDEDRFKALERRVEELEQFVGIEAGRKALEEARQILDEADPATRSIALELLDWVARH